MVAIAKVSERLPTMETCTWIVTNLSVVIEEWLQRPVVNKCGWFHHVVKGLFFFFFLQTIFFFIFSAEIWCASHAVYLMGNVPF